MENLDLKNKYDLVVHLLDEANLSDEDRLKGVIALFPEIGNNENYNDQFASDYLMENYGYGRSVGLSLADAAHAADLSETVVRQMLKGQGLSVDKFKTVIKADLYASSSMKRKHINNLNTAGDEGDYKASIAFLEKMYPTQYGKKLAIEEKLTVEEGPLTEDSKMELARRVAFMLADAANTKKKADEEAKA